MSRRHLGRALLAVGVALAACRGTHPDPMDVDVDGDGFAAPVDCNDRDPAVHDGLMGWLDEDGDGFGAGGEWLCTAGGLPPRYVPTGGDCAPADPLAWRAIRAVADRDGDGFTVTEAGTVCAGATVPAPYLAAPNGNDCNDADATLHRWAVLYPDQDKDGVGARPRSVSCLGEALPAATSVLGSDPDDLDPAVVAPLDDDGFDILD